MKTRNKTALACVVASVLVASSVSAEPPLAPRTQAPPPAPLKLTLPATSIARRSIDMPASELPTAAGISNAGFSSKAAFIASSSPSPDSSNLSAPVTITYSGGSPVLLVTDTGTNKGIESLITNSHDASSALYGQTNGAGAGLTGYNSGTVGPGGKFGILNSSSQQAGAFTTTNGLGHALDATITNPTSNQPAILGQTLVTQGLGVGVEGDGNSIGVVGSSNDGIALSGSTNDGYGLYAQTDIGVGAYVTAGEGIGLVAHSASSRGISSTSDSGTAIYAQSNNAYGVFAYDSGIGNGVYGFSRDGYGIYGDTSDGYAGYFTGQVYVSSLLEAFEVEATYVKAQTFIQSSDRNAKARIRAVDSKDILEKVRTMPVSLWVFKNDPDKNHVGPMAQDFHAAFGLDGDDDKHINMTDIAGVSLASIQELSKEIQQKDEEIAELKQSISQMKLVTETVVARMTALERQLQPVSLLTQDASLNQYARHISH